MTGAFCAKCCRHNGKSLRLMYKFTWKEAVVILYMHSTTTPKNLCIESTGNEMKFKLKLCSKLFALSHCVFHINYFILFYRIVTLFSLMQMRVYVQMSIGICLHLLVHLYLCVCKCYFDSLKIDGFTHRRRILMMIWVIFLHRVKVFKL